MVCSVGDGYRGLGGDVVASLRVATVLEREEQIEEADLSIQRTRYRAAKDEYRRW